MLNVNRMENFAVEEGDDLPSGSVLYLPGLERKLKKREPLAHALCLMQSIVLTLKVLSTCPL